MLEGASVFLVVARIDIPATGNLKEKSEDLIFLPNNLILLKLLIKRLEPLDLLVKQELIVRPGITIAHDFVAVLLLRLRTYFFHDELLDVIRLVGIVAVAAHVWAVDAGAQDSKVVLDVFLDQGVFFNV